MAFAAQISRTLLSLPALNVNDETSGYKIVSFQPGGVTPENAIVTSPLSDGAYVTSTRLGTETASLTVRVYGSDWATLVPRVNALQAALMQRSFTMTVSDGATTIAEWTCIPSASVPNWDRQDRIAGWVNVAVTLVRQPVRP